MWNFYHFSLHLQGRTSCDLVFGIGGVLQPANKNGQGFRVTEYWIKVYPQSIVKYAYYIYIRTSLAVKQNIKGILNYIMKDFRRTLNINI